MEINIHIYGSGLSSAAEDAPLTTTTLKADIDAGFPALDSSGLASGSEAVGAGGPPAWLVEEVEQALGAYSPPTNGSVGASGENGGASPAEF